MTLSNHDPVRVAALYKFAALGDFDALRELRTPLAAFCCGRGIKGTLLLAQEGINGTVAGSKTDIADLIAYLESIEGLADLEVKYSSAAEMPFHRMKVRLKREIVTMGVEDLDPATGAGTYVAPADWNALISDADTIVIDTRNAYEVSIGTFEGAIDPRTSSFREFPAWVEKHRDQLDGRKVAMFFDPGREFAKARRARINGALESADRHFVSVAGVDDDGAGVRDQRVPVGRRDIGARTRHRVEILDAHGDDLALQPHLHAMERHFGGAAVFNLEIGKAFDGLKIIDQIGDIGLAPGNRAVDAFLRQEQRALDAAAAAEGGERRPQGPQHLEVPQTGKFLERGDAHRVMIGQCHRQATKPWSKRIQGSAEEAVLPSARRRQM